MKRSTRTIASIAMAMVMAASVSISTAITASAAVNSTMAITSETKADDVTFKPGVWYSPDDESTALIINEDGHSGALMNVEYNIGVPIDYEHDGGDYVFHIGSADNNTPAAVTMVDDGEFPVAKITWTEGTETKEAFYSWTGFETHVGFELGKWEDKENKVTFTVLDNETATLDDAKNGTHYDIIYKYSFGNGGNFIFSGKTDDGTEKDYVVSVDFVSKDHMIIDMDWDMVFNVTRAAE